MWGVGSTVLSCVRLFSHCWLDARGGQTGKMTDCWVVAGVAGLSLCQQLSACQLPPVDTETLRGHLRQTAVGLPEIPVYLRVNTITW